MSKQFTCIEYKHTSKQSIKITMLTDAHDILLELDLKQADHAESSRLMTVLQNARLKAPPRIKAKVDYQQKV